jgi:hypothetical protein
MKHIPLKHYRILAVAPSTRGFGFAVLEGREALVDWGVKSVDGDKNARSLERLEALVACYLPEIIIMEDHSAKGSRRSPRIRELGRQIIAAASKRKIRVALFSQQAVRRTFFADGEGTKHALAEILAKRFPEELDSRLPRKRRPWDSEAHSMDIFEAVALVLVFRLKKEKGSGNDRANRILI